MGQILWRRKWQPTPGCLPGKSEDPGRLQSVGLQSQTQLSDWAWMWTLLKGTSGVIHPTPSYRQGYHTGLKIMKARHKVHTMVQSWKEEEGTSGWGDRGGIWSGTWHTTGVLGWCFANFRITFPLIVCLFQIPPPITSLAFWELTHLPLILFSNSLHLYLVPWFYPRPGYLFDLVHCLSSWLSWLGKPQVSTSGTGWRPQRSSVYSEKTKGHKQKHLPVSGWLLLNTEVVLMGFKFLI